MCWVLSQGPSKRWCASKPLTICTTWTTSDPKLHRCPSEPASQNTFNRIDPWKKAKIQRSIRLPPKWPIKTTLWSCTRSILKHQFANKKTQECCCYWWMLPYNVWHIFKKIVDLVLDIGSWTQSWSILLTWFDAQLNQLRATTWKTRNVECDGDIWVVAFC